MSQNTKRLVGPWVDIFALDNVPDDEKLRARQFKTVQFYHKLISFFLLTRVTKNDKGIKRTLKKSIEKTNNTLYKYYFFLPFLYKRRLHHMTKYSHQNTEYVAELGYMFYDNYKMFYKQLIKTKSIKNLETGIFEDLKAPIPSDSDSILKTSYGDYMTLPPEADRKIHQIKYL